MFYISQRRTNQRHSVPRPKPAFVCNAKPKTESRRRLKRRGPPTASLLPVLPLILGPDCLGFSRQRQGRTMLGYIEQREQTLMGRHHARHTRVGGLTTSIRDNLGEEVLVDAKLLSFFEHTRTAISCINVHKSLAHAGSLPPRLAPAPS